MSDHYYSSSPESSHHKQEISTRLIGQDMTFYTDSGVFSKDRVDYGSKVLIETFAAEAVVKEDAHILELGSGYGPVILSLAKAFPGRQYTGVEVNERALDLAKENELVNQAGPVHWLLDDARTSQADQPADHVLTNPPIRAGKETIQGFVRNAFDSLKLDGSLWLVIQKKQGAPSMKQFMTDLFGNVERVGLDKGYWILKSNKTT